MTRDPSVFLKHIQLCLDRIDDYVRDGKTAFLADTKTQDAVIRNLEIIGQAVKDYDVGALAAAAPAVPWQQISALRNVLAHQYLGVDISLLWNIVEFELPRLRKAISAMPPDAS
ncbi:MAG: HepT-like ribonuclease domain-containing protein [Betaproteobacteria bacterium]